jgi:hypothetical protein
VRNNQNEGEEEEKENKVKKIKQQYEQERKPSTFFGRILPYSILGSTPIAENLLIPEYFSFLLFHHVTYFSSLLF